MAKSKNREREREEKKGEKKRTEIQLLLSLNNLLEFLCVLRHDNYDSHVKLTFVF